MVVDNNFYMNLAIKEAWKYQGLTYPNPAVGCVVVGENKELLAIEAHQRAGDPHAEVMALKESYYKLTNDSKILDITNSVDIHNFLLLNHTNCFKNISLYTTLEPCSHVGKTPSCANLISLLGIKEVYVGSTDFNEEASLGNNILNDNNIIVHKDILKRECDNLLFPFKKFKNSNFIFFKWAQRLDGTTDNETVSSKDSRKNVHAMRGRCDLLVIGGNTVRIDRPTLDARLANEKAPDILIFSREKEFDRNIPLFNIKNRKVFIEDNFDILKKYNNIMIEGSSNMFELTKDIIDFYLCYQAPTFGGTSGFKNLKEKFEILNIQKECQDIIMWMKLWDNGEDI